MGAHHPPEFVATFRDRCEELTATLRNSVQATLSDGPAPDGAEEESSADDRPSTSLLSPRERILALLDARGGTMRQGDIVADVEWSKSTVSRNLAELEDAGAIRRYWLGNEKLVVVPGAEPAGLASPFDDEPADSKNEAEPEVTVESNRPPRA